MNQLSSLTIQVLDEVWAASDFCLVELEKDCGPYKKGNIWAEPDVEHAAELMRLVYENRELAIKVGEIASNDIKTYFSPSAKGQKILQRLEHIRNQKGFI